MNAEKLQAIKERAEKATVGPWFIDGAIDVHGACGGEVAAVWDAGPDIEFIAQARQDIPELVAEIEWLLDALDNAAGYISIGESAKANDFICRALGVDINHYGIYGEEGDE